MTGGGGADRFVRHPGDGTLFVSDFRVEDGDIIVLAGFSGLDTADDILISQSGDDVVLDLGGGEQLTLENINADGLSGYFVGGGMMFATLPPPPQTVTVTVLTPGGFDFRQLNDLLAGADPSLGSRDETHFSVVNPDAGIKIDLIGSGLDYGLDGSIAAGTITAIHILDLSDNLLATATGYNISAPAFAAAVNLFAETHDPSELNAIFGNAIYDFTGNAGADAFSGGGFDDTLRGVGGDDTFAGGAGADTFVYASGGGIDTIIDFNKGEGDTIDLTGVAGLFSFDDLNISQNGADTVITLGSGLILKNVDMNTLDAGDFRLAEPPAPLVFSVTGTIQEFTGTPGAEQLTSDGMLRFSDVDVHDTHTPLTPTFNAAASNVGSPLGTLMTTMLADTVSGTGGLLHWSYAANAADVEYLSLGQQRIEAFDVAIDDYHDGIATQKVTVTITGTNDAPEIKGAASETHDVFPPVGDQSGFGLADNFSFKDPDAQDTHEVSVSFNAQASQNLPESFDWHTVGSFTAELLNDSTVSSDGLVHWEFDVAPGDQLTEFNELPDDSSLVFDVNVTDLAGAVATHQVVVHVFVN